ncbi:hypothetical protein C0Q70_07162 [Pomacea canaliculata]|uniref:Eukaryotic translation initiation factor 4E transporter n=1 Tax=Pomacea canaliculata TaxID=400727 RepID=A0A2T7PE95_POMCA|nr:eukaryotic translation initiation factor 4E transporter-like isoform X3 [Pomacea canaliculata]PVD31744.1 hypothetical protein C0Q70_07162 [Pomacea canaliculata]
MDKEDTASVSEDEDMEEQQFRRDTPGPMPEHQYSRKKLIEISETFGAKLRPSCLSKEFDTSEGLWDPEKWFRSFGGGSRENSPLNVPDGRERRRHSDMVRPSEIDRDLCARNRKFSVADPRERLKEERDGIVLSPQRRSFGTGCHVSQTSSSIVISSSTSVYRQSSINERDERERDRRDQRRIGSGRIQIDRDQGRDYHAIRDRDRDRNERDRDRDRDRERRFNERPDRSDRFRRSDSRDFGDKMAERRERDFNHRERDRDERRFDRGRRRYNSHEEAEAPEWYTGGPTSQTDTIELRGFERKGHSSDWVLEEEREEDGKEGKQPMEDDEEEETENGKKGKLVNAAGDAKANGPLVKVDHGFNVGKHNGNVESVTNFSEEISGEFNVRPSPQPSPHRINSVFDLDQFLKIDHIPGLEDLLQEPQAEVEPYGDGGAAEPSGSRFSKWFNPAAAAGMADQSNGTFHGIDFIQRQSPANVSEDFSYLHEILDGARSPVTHSPPLSMAAQLFGEKNFFAPFPINQDTLTPGPEHYTQQKNLPPIVSAMFQNSAAEKSGSASTPSSRGSFSTQDAEVQLKAILFGGARDSASSSGTASPANVPPGVQRKMKTVAELEADMHQNSPKVGASPSSTPQHGPTAACQGAAPAAARSDDGDQTAFNKLLSLIKGGSNTASSVTALLRNKEQQRQIQQMTLQNMHHPIPSSVTSQQVSQPPLQVHLQQQQQQILQPQPMLAKVPIVQHAPPQHTPQVVAPRPVLAQGLGRLPVSGPSSQDPIINFLQQNPTIVMKPPSPTPINLAGLLTTHAVSAQGPIPSPLPTGLPPPSIRVTSQQGNTSATARVPSPIMFSQQPPLHLSAPSPIHPSQLAPLPGQSLSPTSTLTTTSGMRSPVLQRVPSPQELVAHTQAILQNALIKRKLEDQKERYLKKQQERAKSPCVQSMAIKTSTTTTSTMPVSSQSKPASMAFTPTSVIRKMHSDRVSEKEKQTKDGENDDGDSSTKLQKQGSDSFDSSTVSSGDTGINEPSDLHTPSSFNSNLSALSGHLEEALHLDLRDDGQMAAQQIGDSLDDKVVFGTAIPILGPGRGGRPLVGQAVAPPSSPGMSLAGRAIVKGSADTPASVAAAIMSQPRPLTGCLTGVVKMDGEPRPIVAGSSGTLDVGKLMDQKRHQQQQQIQASVRPSHLSTPFPRPVGAASAPPPPFMPITATPRLSLQPASPASMQSALLMQQINRVNHINQMNQLAALQVQQRMMPLHAIMPTVTPGAPLPQLSPRTSTPAQMSSVAALGITPNSSSAISSVLKRAFSSSVPIFTQATKPAVNGPLASLGSSVVTSTAPLNNRHPSDGEILKWFSPEVLKTQLPSMPPLPTHGTKVMTVDEIERN